MAGKIVVDRYPFVHDHGEEPRGYGMWAFRLIGPGGRVGDLVWATGNYGRSLEQVREQAKLIGADRIEVQP